MHVFTHLKPSSVGKTGHGLYPDGMVELDGLVGQLLEKLDDLGVADNTIVVFTTDNGAEVLSWPDGGATPFRGEKDTNWEGGWRVPCVMRWPGVIKPGRVDQRDLCRSRTSCRRSRRPPVSPTSSRRLKKGYQIGDTTFKVHLDGFNLLPFLSGKEKESPRKGFVYWSDDGDLMALARAAIQGRVRRTAQQGPRCLARAAVDAAHPQDVRPALRSVRTRRGELQVQRLVRRARPVSVRRAGDRSPVARELQRVPAAAERIGRAVTDRSRMEFRSRDGLMPEALAEPVELDSERDGSFIVRHGAGAK